MLHLAKYRDVFISYGHHPETNRFTQKLCADLRHHRISTWIDTDIQQGTRWREEIQDAIKYSGVMLIVLSKKWVDSNYCKGEAGMALNMNRPIYVLLPPVSENQRVGRLAIPEGMKKTLSERQFFNDFETRNVTATSTSPLERFPVESLALFHPRTPLAHISHCLLLCHPRTRFVANTLGLGADQCSHSGAVTDHGLQGYAVGLQGLIAEP